MNVVGPPVKAVPESVRRRPHPLQSTLLKTVPECMRRRAPPPPEKGHHGSRLQHGLAHHKIRQLRWTRWRWKTRNQTWRSMPWTPGTRGSASSSEKWKRPSWKHIAACKVGQPYKQELERLRRYDLRLDGTLMRRARKAAKAGDWAELSKSDKLNAWTRVHTGSATTK